MSATFYRMNNLTMMELRSAVLKADEAGDAAQIQQAVNKLGDYVTHHMHTDMGDGFMLQYSYDRAYQAAAASTIDSSDTNSQAYQKASIDCQTERYQYGGYVRCVQSKVASLSSDVPVSEIAVPRSEPYWVDFASPLWSPDFAGFSVLITVFLIVLIIARITGVIVLRLLLKLRFKSIS